MKKKVIVGSFTVLIILTAIFTAAAAVQTYVRETNEPEPFFVGLGAFIVLVIGGLAVLYEADLFHLVYYFAAIPKTKAKTAINILANIDLILIIVFGLLSGAYAALRKYEAVPPIMIAVYFVLRAVYLIVSYSGTTFISQHK